MDEDDYYNWDDDDVWEIEPDGNNWCWYYVNINDWFTDQPIEQPWPVFAEGFDEAMTIYEVLLRKANT